MSRCTAHINYELPTDENAYKIFKVLAEQFEIKVQDEEIKKIIKNYFLSGRDIKSLLKLSKFLAEKEEKLIDYELFEYCIQFLHIKKK